MPLFPQLARKKPKVTKLTLQSVRVGKNILIASEDRENFRYTDGARWLLIPDNSYTDVPIPLWMYSSLWGLFFTGYILRHTITAFELSRVTNWTSTGQPITEPERAQIKRNLLAAAPHLTRRFEIR